MSSKPFVRIDATQAGDTSIAHAGGRHLDRDEYDALLAFLGKLNHVQVRELVGDQLQGHLVSEAIIKLLGVLRQPAAGDLLPSDSGEGRRIVFRETIPTPSQ